VKLGLAHRTLEAQEQAVIVSPGIIDAFFVDNQGICQDTDLDETIPVAARASQAGGLQAQHGASTSETNLRNERLKTVSVSGRGAGLTLILVNDEDPLTWPTQIKCALDQIVLTGGAGGVLEHLSQARLTNVNESQTVEMVRPDLVGG
jgi:hypothetical protein